MATATTGNTTTSLRSVRVAEIMSPHVFTCRTTDTLNRAAQLMWEHDCGALPVTNAHLSTGDITRAAHETPTDGLAAERVVAALAEICRPQLPAGN